jgi:selenide,water dikinase
MEEQTSTPIKLTSFSSQAGCSCKIAPAVLQQILQGNTAFQNTNLLVGNSANDDAAVFKISEEQAIVCTTDFFTPIVDDAFTFGQIAAANAISDVYAMGATPTLALGVLGFPTQKLPIEIAQQIIKGAIDICNKANIPLAGGHSIDIQEPIFGLNVTGTVAIKNIKQNNGAKVGDLLLLTKPIGIGMLTTAAKRDLLNKEETDFATQQLVLLNKVGEALGKIVGVTALTDITGFGLLGHATEMAKASAVSIQLQYNKIPLYQPAILLAEKRITPDASFRNWNAYSPTTNIASTVNMLQAFSFLPDPQTNGGLLMSVEPNSLQQVQTIFKNFGLEFFCEPIGEVIQRAEKLIYVV